MRSFLFCYHNFLLSFLSEHGGGTEAGEPRPGLGRPTGLFHTQLLGATMSSAHLQATRGKAAMIHQLLPAGGRRGPGWGCRQPAQRPLVSSEYVALPRLGATNSRGAFSPAQHVCHELVWALEFLELISVNLLLFPWKKKVRSLKVGTAVPLSKGVWVGAKALPLGKTACPSCQLTLVPFYNWRN